jgi:hypothetical protein
VDEAIRHHDVGRSVRHGDVTGFVAAVRALAADDTIHTRARQAFEEHYSDRATLPAFDRVLDSDGR